MSQGHKRTKPKDNNNAKKETSQEALRQAEEKYHNIFEHSLDGIFQSTPAGRFLTVNPALARIWGYESPEDVINSITNIAHQVYVNPEQRKEFMQLMDEYGEVEAFEFQAYRKDGSIIWIQENVRMVRDANGNLQYYEGTVKDITEQKQTLEALRRSEERYRRTLNNMLEGCQIIDYDWRYIYVNDTAALHGRRKPEELLMRTMMEIYPGIENTEMFRILKSCMENRRHQRFENEFVYPDGDVGWFELSVEPVPEGLFVLSVDITERKQAESELREREIRYRTLFENLPIPVFTKDREGRYTSFNDEESKYWTQSPLGHTDHELLPPEIADSLRAVDLRVMQTEEPSYGEDKFQAPSGTRYILMRKVPLYDSDGNVAGILGAGLDITERKQAELDLRDREVRYRTLFENLPIPVFTKDRDGRYTSCNAEEAKYWVENPVGHTDHELLPHEIADDLRAADVSIMEKEEPIFGEEKFQTPSGLKYALVRKVPLYDGAGNVIGVLGASLDITGRKQAEKKLKEAEQFAQSTIDALTAHICVLDENGVILSVNRAWHEFADANPPVPPNHFIGANYLAVCDTAQGEASAEAASFAAGLRSVMQNERAHFSLEYPCNVPGGEKRWFVARITRFTINEAARLVVAHENISERRMMEEALRASDARFSTAFHASPLATAITRMKDNHIVDVNQTWLELAGLSREEALGHTALELNLWFDPDERTNLIEQLQKQGRVQGFEVHLQKKSGEIADLLFSAELIELSGEAHMLSMALDISGRKRAEKELLESEERYRDLVDSSQELICTHDLDGNILSANPWASKTLGYPMEELLKKNIVDFIIISHRAEFQKYLAEVKENGRARGLMTVQTSSGEKLIWEYNNSLRTEGVEEPIVRGMAHDVTEQRRAEKKIKQQLARLTAVNEIDRVIASSFDLGLTLNLLLRHVVRQLDLDAAVILLADPNTKVLEYIAGEGFLGSETKELKLRIGEDYAGRVALERRMIHVPNLATAERPFSQPHLITNEKFVAYFGLPLIAKGQLNGVLEVFKRAPLDADEDWLSYLETLAEQAAIAIDNAQLFNNLQQTNADLSLAYDATIEGWSYALDLRDKETEGHTQRVTELTTKLGRKFGLNKKELTYTRWGALLHDIGKMGVPDAILQKPGSLTDEEWGIMKMHPVYARNMLERIHYLKSAIDIPYCHHEKWDGSGYPRGLKGEQIPLPARIFAVVDVWDALTSDRPYRPAWKKRDALDYIKSASGTHFDPRVVNVFLESDDLWTNEGE